MQPYAEQIVYTAIIQYLTEGKYTPEFYGKKKRGWEMDYYSVVSVDRWRRRSLVDLVGLDRGTRSGRSKELSLRMRAVVRLISHFSEESGFSTDAILGEIAREIERDHSRGVRFYRYGKEIENLLHVIRSKLRPRTDKSRSSSSEPLIPSNPVAETDEQNN